MNLLTWNVQWFCGLDGQVDVARVLAHAQSLGDPDVICLQEVAAHYPGLEACPDVDQAALVQQALPGFQVFFGAAVDEWRPGLPPGCRQRFGNLVATRLPVLQVQHHPLPYPADAGVPSMPRMVTVVTVQAAWGPCRVMTTHLEYFSAPQRLAQAQALRGLHAEAVGRALQPPLGSEPPDTPFQARSHATSAVLCGDFNFEVGSEGHLALAAAGETPVFCDAWRALHGAGVAQPPTFHVHSARYSPVPVACDFVWVSEDLAPRVQAVAVDGATTLSDHQPVLLRLA